MSYIADPTSPLALALSRSLLLEGPPALSSLRDVMTEEILKAHGSSPESMDFSLLLARKHDDSGKASSSSARPSKHGKVRDGMDTPRGINSLSVSMNSCLFWNCRGLLKKASRDCIRNLSADHSISMLLLVVTHINRRHSRNFIWSMGRAWSGVYHPGTGRSDCLLVTWGTQHLEVSLLYATDSVMHVCLLQVIIIPGLLLLFMAVIM